MLAYFFVLLAVAVRFLPHPFAFTPVGASLLFFGARGPRKQMWVPLVLLAGSDVILTTMFYRMPFTWDHFASWAWYATMLWLGTRLQKGSPLRVISAALLASVSFFLVSNFAVWAAWRDLYPMTFNGLMACYDAGLPFFRRSIEGDLLFTAAMFSTPVVLHALAERLRKPQANHLTAA